MLSRDDEHDSEDEQIRANLRQKRQKKSSFKDAEFYIPYVKPDAHAERGYAITQGTTFLEKTQNSTLDFVGDDLTHAHTSRSTSIKWDRKKKKYIRGNTHQDSVRNEAGVLIKSSYKTNRFAV
jgi:ATP-dependent RNA helicase DDX54/DBP10